MGKTKRTSPSIPPQADSATPLSSTPQKPAEGPTKGWMNPAYVESCFRQASIIESSLLGMFEGLRQEGEEGWAQRTFALWEVAFKLQRDMQVAYIGPEDGAEGGRQ